MKNIWKIFRADVSHIKNNVIALIRHSGTHGCACPLCVV